ncbi:IS110 family transposase [Paracoccus sp. MBLB3053]|uniref:IS110 family transposase n=1 Tax=Paracoccus aurantius TaxID=3073814 RepID=A0ABU2HXJ2_9RHOB|nr:IS110 family transposase [Paracoccus sp. MBLB3053]MDS9469073.1 IS110 family transposase [Paracoccus sp. MBLB3053]MDS9469743.1 IS110 family transposase [Paracoccus sp. MBLB3053]
MRIIGLDIHRVVAEAVALEGATVTNLGRIGMTREHLAAFAATLKKTDHVIVEATGNATAVVEILTPHVARVAVANPLQVHLIAKAKTKTDKIDARVLAQLYAAGFLPEVWVPDEATLARRRQVTRRTQIVKHRVRLKGIVQSVLHAHLVPRCPHVDIFGIKGRAWLKAQYLPDDERDAIARHIDEYDRLTEALKGVERDIARAALEDAQVKRMMTAPGVDMVVAVGVMAAIGRIDRFDNPDKLISYFGLNPSVRQSGDGPAYHGRITKRGRSGARHLLVEAAWQAIRVPGPLRAFYERICARRGNHIAAVAVARKLTVLIWHMLTKGEDYIWVRPALMTRKMRSLELAAGLPARRGQRGATYAYNLPEHRRADRAVADQAESSYRRMTQGWRKRGPERGAGATNEERR